ncbi:hypothetical protein H634G_07908 [Metarhizium anisopliae BRIP 53293]|uniref:Uncharacterized protein n=1 Tax=Metarhizium anisopliae BRIP 53293 TaxID=1291518 RepID=A0A0D9NSN7_METAN|nr:hypothetical protein H634G_07908 [Metarhizium anisopliae BRIP 53293]KJK93573.1 hypothetical protein H633G_02524 [Metarhizium anisopliae BRIP 53284]
MKLSPEEIQRRLPRHVLKDGHTNSLDLCLLEKVAFAWYKMAERRRNPIREGHYRVYHIDGEGRFQYQDWDPTDWSTHELTDRISKHMLLLHDSAELRQKCRIPHRYQGAERLFAALTLAYYLVATYRLMFAASNPGCHLEEILFVLLGFVQIDRVFYNLRATRITSERTQSAARRS